MNFTQVRELPENKFLKTSEKIRAGNLAADLQTVSTRAPPRRAILARLVREAQLRALDGLPVAADLSQQGIKRFGDSTQADSYFEGRVSRGQTGVPEFLDLGCLILRILST